MWKDEDDQEEGLTLLPNKNMFKKLQIEGETTEKQYE